MRGKRIKTLLLTGVVLLTATGFMGCAQKTQETPDTKVEDKNTEENKDSSKEDGQQDNKDNKDENKDQKEESK